jgi:hypothetical protein
LVIVVPLPVLLLVHDDEERFKLVGGGVAIAEYSSSAFLLLCGMTIGAEICSMEVEINNNTPHATQVMFG